MENQENSADEKKHRKSFSSGLLTITDDSLMGHLLNIDSNAGKEMLISSNPFDTLTDTPYAERKTLKAEQKPVAILKNDEDLLSSLSKATKGNEAPVKPVTPGIFRKARIIANEDIEVPSKRYFRFPFQMGITDDGSPLCRALSKELFIAATSAYLNYRKFGEAFKVVYANELICFGSSVWASFGAERLLSQNEVRFTRAEDGLIVQESDVALIYDIIVNPDADIANTFPFILSEFPFENGMNYHTRIEKGPVISVGQKTEQLFYVHGPLYNLDFTTKEEIKIEFID